MRRDRRLEDLIAGFQLIIDLPLRPVHDGDRNFSVRVPARGRFQIRIAGCGVYNNSAGSEEFAEVSQIVVGGIVGQLSGRGVGKDGSGAEISGMVRAAGGIQNEIPVNPALRPVVQAADDIMPVALPDGVAIGMRAAFRAGLGMDQVLFRIGLVGYLHVRERVGLRFSIPVKGHAPDEFPGIGIAENAVRIMFDLVLPFVIEPLVVIVDQDL